jgi:hypothetical protein
MSIPRKHHYVPQVHIRKFKEENGYFVFRKTDNKLINFKSSSNFFVAKDLNSTLNDEGEIDHETAESEFEKIWDGKFNCHFNIISSWIVESIKNNCNSSIRIEESIKFFFEYGLIGYQRALKQSQEFNDSILNPILEFEELLPELEDLELDDFKLSEEEFKMGIDSYKDFIILITNHVKTSQELLKYPVPIATELKMLIPENCSCDIILSKNSSFFLPDCTAIILKSEETMKYQDRDINKIVSVGIPISSGIYLQIRNKEFFSDHETDLYAWNIEKVDEWNEEIIRHSFNQTLVSENFKI